MLLSGFHPAFTRIVASFLFAATTLAPIQSATFGPVETPLVVVSNPPPIQVLVPGFTVRELPLALNNLNNLVFAPDGRLFALAYDGNVFQLKDSDGDGLEDTATHFFKNDRGEIPASIGMAWGPGGLYIASRGKVIHLRDKGDGTADLQTVTGGWLPPTKAAGSNLDAVGLAVDRSGNIYFGLGCDAWSEAYKLNKETGESEYQQFSERGAILKLSQDWKRRDIICTGVRFTVSLAFNVNGDLFATDQEGATWLSNGNPFDELLHIQPGRHYGFPPRHPRYLPGAIDEPSVFNYRPQHQSTCGLHFNDAAPGSGKIFGPDWWKSDAFVAGESRGKIWRTKLIKSAAGYVAKTDLLACLSMLTIDAVPTPQGDLLVACHSGAPDWGTGPQGQGRIFKIAYADKAAPQPVLAYASSPTETRVIFDRPLAPEQFKNLAAGSSVTMGEHVGAGDRFESFVPGYQVVKNQSLVRRYEIPVLSAGISADNTALILQTAPRMEFANYAWKLPEPANQIRTPNPARREQPQHAAIDLLTDLSGVDTIWQDAAGTTWNGWLPHPDLRVARSFTSASPEHRRLFDQWTGSGSLRMKGQVDLQWMLRTAIQPGSKLDFDYPTETVTIVFKSHTKLEVRSKAGVQWVSDTESRITAPGGENNWVPFEVLLATGGGEPTLDVSWFTAEDFRPRALPLRRILMPWAKPASAGPPQTFERIVPEIVGGDWNRGHQVFLSETAACFKCHRLGSEGGMIGPDLSNLIHRDYASVLKDIIQPSAAINPDHITYNIDLADGGSASGVVIADTPEKIILGQVTGVSVEVSKSKIARMKSSAVSLMPEGLFQALSASQQKDLMTFLLTEPSKK